NTYLPKTHAGEIATKIELIRSTEEEKGQQIANADGFRRARNASVKEDDRTVPGSLAQLQQMARDRKNVFASLIEAVKYNSLGQISHALYEVGGEYRRNM